MIRFVLLAMLAVASTVPAAATAPRMPARPRRLGMCASCHGERGIAQVPGVPDLAGQPQAYLVHALRQYRDGKRPNAEMHAAAGPLGDADMKQLARWFSSQSRACSAGRKN